MELPDKQNQSNISCIPEGMYTCKKILSPHFGETFEVCNVPNRKHILFHTGNIAKYDSNGCILVGRSIGKMNGDPAIFTSRVTFREFMEQHKDIDEFTLFIMDFS